MYTLGHFSVDLEGADYAHHLVGKFSIQPDDILSVYIYPKGASRSKSISTSKSTLIAHTRIYRLFIYCDLWTKGS